MTELDTRPESTLAERQQYDHLSKLGKWAMDAQQANVVAQSLARTKFVPEAMQGKPAEITAAILTGQEIGLEPMSALRSLDIIQGTPAMRAHALRGLVQSRGHEVWIEDSSDTRVVAKGRRNGSDVIQTVVWDMDRAKKMELTGKPNWRKMPQHMLIARATAEVCRLIASDVLLGMPYATEELDDEVTVDESPAVRQPKGPRRTAQRKPLAAAPAPELEEPTGEDSAEDADSVAPVERSSDDPSFDLHVA
ncbi:hypothetical protein [Saccharopolyspora taberi]|uniref:Uncharacterized protein n=1 Tax=Saccharopolyspora taberi TaxID=60895 RepID=A0ABN3V0D0_9PSEU